MKRYLKYLFCFSLCLLALPAMAQRKLPAKAYMTSAKIDVLEGRPEEAIAMLDTLFMVYGPVSEGLELMGQIMVDYTNKANNVFDKTPLVEKMVAYFDSLRMCCSNEKIDKKFRKDCDVAVAKIDSIQIQFWRESYNKGLEDLNSIDEFLKEEDEAADSQMMAYYKTTIQAKADSCVANMKLAIKLNQKDHRPFIAIASAYEKLGKYEDAVKWFEDGLKFVSDSSQMLLSIAYDYVNLDKYCEAIPTFEAYFRLNPTDLPNANNLCICYIRCEKYDQAIATYKKILTVDSTHPDALLGLGSFYRRQASELTKKAKQLLEDKNDAEGKQTREQANQVFDTASQYYERYIRTYPDSISGYDEYGLINYILGKYDKAASAFKKLTEMQPDKVDNWISLGDSYFSLNDFPNAVTGYERAVALSPEKKAIWERLSFLYNELGKPDKKAEADKKIQSIKD